jgi:hypothetical protein
MSWASTEDELEMRMQTYQRISALTHIPWHYLAAIDQYERTMRFRERNLEEHKIAIRVAERQWSGHLNPLVDDVQLHSIMYFDGLGRDGSGDGKAERTNDLDVLQSISEWILRYGVSDEDILIAMWDYYNSARTVHRIEQFAQIYASNNKLELHETMFPLPPQSHYTYRSTWGAARGWGGRRIHEGTDLFAGHGVPVRSTNHGVIETMGWNNFGGWRVGIRDLNNVYHYFAHLGGFNRSLAVGDIVKPGEIVGWVGSSGYGKPGTSGKFPPHLHYGTYRDHGDHDWAFDPYPKLRASERANKR